MANTREEAAFLSTEVSKRGAGELASDPWEGVVGSWLDKSAIPAYLVGLGNPLKRDDGVGLEVVSDLHRRLGGSPAPGIRIPRPTTRPERLVSKLASRNSRLVIIDAVEADRSPGTIVCAPLGKTKFGLFATHNVPLKLFPEVAADLGRILLVGVQPEDVGVGEGLSDTVAEAKKALEGGLIRVIGGR
jgi:hydrogenase maturation protease